MALSLGVIADDFTGATDIAGFMVQHGWRVVQLTAIPQQNDASDQHSVIPPDTDAIVISLKSRSCPAEEAVQSSLSAARWLRQAGCRQIFFKYCSTFDSTAQGNIGPVTDALMQELGSDITLVCPALPINGRTVIHGHLFVNGVLLNQCGMQNHPITPMHDANLLRLMEQQSNGKAGLLPLEVIRQGEAAIQQKVVQLQEQGVRYVVADALNMDDLLPLAAATATLPLLTGGSGLGAALASHASGQSMTPVLSLGFTPPRADRRAVVLSGSCSSMTNQQVAHYRQLAPALALDISRTLNDVNYPAELADWVLKQCGPWAPMLYATQDAEALQTTQRQFGAAQASGAVERTFANVARLLQQQGVNTFIIAGGETSGVVVQSLAVQMVAIGAPIAPGVPWVQDLQHGCFLALKSGNFGSVDFFQHAQEMYHE